jgi:hypothetical protein
VRNKFDINACVVATVLLPVHMEVMYISIRISEEGSKGQN